VKLIADELSYATAGFVAIIYGPWCGMNVLGKLWASCGQVNQGVAGVVGWPGVDVAICIGGDVLCNGKL